MKKGWQIKTLADVCTFENGDRGVNYPSKVKRTSVGIPFINAGHFVDNKIDLTNMDYISRERYNLMGRGKIQKGDILFCLRGSLGKFASVGDLPEGQIASSLVIVRPSKLVLHEYLLAYFESHFCEENIERFRGGAAQPNLAAKSLTQFTIPIPPLPEQQRIVTLLDETFAGLAQVHANAERNLVNAREVFEAALQEVIENGNQWKTKTLREISLEFGRGKSKNRPRNDPKLYGGKYPFVQTGDIRNSNHYITEYTQTYNEVGLAQSKLWKKGTICITIAANIAETGILDFDACFPDSVIGLVVNPEIADVNFTEYMLRYFKRRLQEKSKGSAQDNLNMEKIESEYFPIPPLEEQRAIVERLDGLAAETSRLEAVYQSKLEAVEELRKSVLKEAFEGRL